MKEFWDTRYADKDYAYGTTPNAFFKEVLDTYYFEGKILLPAEGEGRNAIYAAKQGLEVYAFDISSEGKKKALKLAEKENVEINYEVGDFFDLQLSTKKFDVAALIYAHFPKAISTNYAKKISELIKPNGFLIIEGFSKKHIQFQKKYPNVGGPKNIDLLLSEASVKKDFPNFTPILLEEKEIELKEGVFHNGRGKVIRFIGRKMG